MESRFANSFFSGATTNHTTNNNNNNNRRILENRNGEAHQHKRPKLDICVPRSTCAFKETPKVIERSIIEDESVWEDFDEEDVLEKADCVERASQAFTTSSGDSDQAKCNIEKSGLLTKPIVKPKDKPTISVSKYPQVVSTQRHNSLQTIAKEQPLKKNVIFKAASTGNMKNSYSPSSSSSSSGISLLSHTSFSPRIKVTKKETSEEFPTIAKAPHAIKCKECELLSTQLQTLTEKIQTKDGEISLLRSNLEETRSKTFKGKDEMGSLVEKTHLLEKTISDQNTVISFMSGELQSKSQTCDRLKSSLKQRSTHSSFSASSKASANKATITDASLVNFSQQKEMSFSPDMLTQLAKHDGRLLFDICSAELTESHRPIFFLQNLDGAGEDLQDDRWFVSILFEFQKHQSFSSDVAASCLDKLIAICRGSIEEIDRNGEATVSQYQRVKELYNKHHEIAPLSKSYRFFSPKPWYSEESGIKVRRLLHLISKIIDIEPKLAYIVVSDNSSSVDNCEFKLPRSSNSETSLLYVLRDTLKRIKDECFSLNLNGFLASSASLMISIMKSKIEIDEKGQKLINEILRLILLCCPGPTAMLFACKILLVVDDKYSFINNDLCRNTPKEHMDSERSNTFDEGTCTVTLICYLVQAIKNDPKIYLITDVLVRWLRIIQTKWDKSNHPPWLNWGSLAQLPANHKLLCDCRFELNKLILKLLYEAAELFSNDSHDMKHEEKRSLEMLLDRGIALIFAAAIGEDRSISIEPGEIEAHYELFVHTLSVCSDLNVSSIQQKNLKHLALQEIKEPTRQDVNEDDECTELSRKMCTF